MMKMTRRKIIKQGGLALTAFAVPFSLTSFTKFNRMTDNPQFDVIIIGGSYAGLSAAMALGRSLRNVLIIDSAKPCNQQTPHSHNFLTQDGEAPGAIADKAKMQVLKYDTVKYREGMVVSGYRDANDFTIRTNSGEEFHAKKLIFATGLRDIMPPLPGFSDCWGISVIHCPYCHGYEAKNEKTGVLANGDIAFHYAPLVYNLTKELTVFTNGKASFTQEQTQKLAERNIAVVEEKIVEIRHEKGRLRELSLANGSVYQLNALYARPAFEQQCKLPEYLGCEMTEMGFVKTDPFQKTTLSGVYACGDNASPLRSVANAVATGNMAGAMVNRELCEEDF